MVATVSSYTAQLTRDGKWWVVYVPEIGHATQGRTLAEADEMARDLICLWEEEDRGLLLDAAELDVQLDIQLPDEVRSHLQEADELRAKAQQTHEAAAEQQAEAVRTLRRSGVSMRDAGKALGLSHQRVAQLARG